MIVLVTSGEWYEASASMLVPPEGVDPQKVIDEYPGYQKCRKTLVAWLEKEQGWREPNKDEAIEVYTG